MSLTAETVALSFLIGTGLQLFMTGIGLSGTITYFGNFGNFDRLIYRVAVLALLALALLHAAGVLAGIYSIGMASLLAPANLANIPWPLLFEPGFTALSASIVQIFYAYRVYLISRRSWILTSSIVVLTVATLGLSLYTTVYLLEHPHWSSLHQINMIAEVGAYVLVATDAIISGAMIFHLSKAKADLHDTNSILSRIITIIITSNTLTTAVVIASAVLVFVPGPWSFIAGTNVPQCYQIALLASLNNRAAFKSELSSSHRPYQNPTTTADRSKRRGPQTHSSFNIPVGGTTTTSYDDTREMHMIEFPDASNPGRSRNLKLEGGASRLSIISSLPPLSPNPLSSLFSTPKLDSSRKTRSSAQFESSEIASCFSPMDMDAESLEMEDSEEETASETSLHQRPLSDRPDNLKSLQRISV